MAATDLTVDIKTTLPPYDTFVELVEAYADARDHLSGVVSFASSGMIAHSDRIKRVEDAVNAKREAWARLIVSVYHYDVMELDDVR